MCELTFNRTRFFSSNIVLNIPYNPREKKTNFSGNLKYAKEQTHFQGAQEKLPSQNSHPTDMSKILGRKSGLSYLRYLT